METETEIQQTERPILGEMKEFHVDYPFVFKGERFEAGEKLQVSSDVARQLMTLRTYATFDGSKFHVLAGRVVGGGFTVERCSDGIPKISFWHKKYSEEDDWVVVEYLEPVHGLANQGDRRRLRRSDALEVQHRYIDTNPAASSYHGARIKILENRPRPSISPEESRQRSELIEANMARAGGENWVLGGLKRI
jgi:hypothetical protein